MKGEKLDDVRKTGIYRLPDKLSYSTGFDEFDSYSTL
jgi:hypothetical protein